MNEKKTTTTVKEPNILFHLILFFLTGTLWEAVYNIITILRIKKIVQKHKKITGLKPFNYSPIPNCLLSLTFVGSPIVVYNRYKSLSILNNLLLDNSNQIEDENGEKQEPISAKKITAFSVVWRITFPTFVISFVFLVIHLIKYRAGELADTLWGNGGFMILFILAAVGLFFSVGLTMRLFKEEQRFNKTLHQIANLKKSN
jgi:hypothetical protein